MRAIWIVPIIASFALLGILGFMIQESKWSASDTAYDFTPFTQPIISPALADDDDEMCSAGFMCIAGDDDEPCPDGFICEQECDDDDGDGAPDCELKECEIDGANDGDDTDDGICARELLCDPQACDDSNPCTVDDCDPLTGCTNDLLPDGTSCVLGGDPGFCIGGFCGTL